MGDVFSIANRNRISMSSDMLASMKNSLNEYSLILDFIQNKNPNYLMCSVEKLKQYPEDFCNGLAEFIDFNLTEDNKHKAVSFIQPEPEEYLESSRINRGEGQIGGIKKARFLAGQHGPIVMKKFLWIYLSMISVLQWLSLMSFVSIANSIKIAAMDIVGIHTIFILSVLKRVIQFQSK